MGASAKYICGWCLTSWEFSTEVGDRVSVAEQYPSLSGKILILLVVLVWQDPEIIADQKFWFFIFSNTPLKLAFLTFSPKTNQRRFHNSYPTFLTWLSLKPLFWAISGKELVKT